MTITSLSDLYYIAIGIRSYNILFDILSDTGIIYLPIIMVIYGALNDGFESSKNMADTASTLKSMEIKFYVMVIAYSLAVVPVHPFKIEGVTQYKKMCDYTSNKEIINENASDLLQLGNGQFDNPSDNALTAKNMLIKISGEDLNVPVLLKMVLKLGTGVSAEAVSRLPCTINLISISQELLQNNIKDPVLKSETKGFIKQCYTRAKKMSFLSRDTSLPWISDPDSNDQPWPGHRNFMNSAYYGNEALGMSSQFILKGYESYYEEGKRPTCREWWEGKGAGKIGSFSISNIETSLKQRLIQNMDSALVTKLKMFPDLIDNSAEEDRLLKQYYFNPHNLNEIMKADVKDYGDESEGFLGVIGDVLARGTGLIGMTFDAIPSYAGASLIQLAAPIAKGVVLLVIISILPIAYIVSMYSFKLIVGIHFFVFSVLLWPYLWELAMLVQQSYIEEVISNSPLPIWSMVTQPNVMLISKKLTDGLFLAFPAILTSLLSVAGMSGGQALGNMAGSPGSSVGSAGNRGGSIAQSKGKSAASKAIASKPTPK